MCMKEDAFLIDAVSRYKVTPQGVDPASGQAVGLLLFRQVDLAIQFGWGHNKKTVVRVACGDIVKPVARLHC